MATKKSLDDRLLIRFDQYVQSCLASHSHLEWNAGAHSFSTSILLRLRKERWLARKSHEDRDYFHQSKVSSNTTDLFCVIFVCGYFHIILRRASLARVAFRARATWRPNGARNETALRAKIRILRVVFSTCLFFSSTRRWRFHRDTNVAFINNASVSVSLGFACMQAKSTSFFPLEIFNSPFSFVTSLHLFLISFHLHCFALCYFSALVYLHFSRPSFFHLP